METGKEQNQAKLKGNIRLPVAVRGSQTFVLNSKSKTKKTLGDRTLTMRAVL